MRMRSMGSGLLRCVYLRRKPIDDEWRAFREPRHELQAAAGGFDVAPQRRVQHVAAPFNPRHRVLAHAEPGRKVILGALHGLTQVLERRKLLCALRDPGAALGR